MSKQSLGRWATVLLVSASSAVVQAQTLDQPARSAPAAAPAGNTPTPAPSGAAQGAATQLENTAELARKGAALEPLTSATTARAWAEGVSEERQEQARVRFMEGNALLKEALFTKAAAKYRQALVFWEHPGIHYNLALALINLDRPLDVREHLRAALRFGPAPLDEDRFEQVRNYLRLVEQQLALFEISCDLPGAVVMFDNQVLFRAPGRYEGVAQPGVHLVQASKPGYVAREYRRTLLPGEPTRMKLRLYTDEQLVTEKRRWGFEWPVLLTGTGALITAAGVALLAQSNSKYRGFDNLMATQAERQTACDLGTCTLDPSAEQMDLRDTARAYRTASIAALATGGAALTAGAILTLINLKYSLRLTPEELDKRPSVQPVVGPGFAGITGVGHF